MLSLENKILTFQGNEITEHLIYKKLSESVKDSHNKKILKRISEDELKHYNSWKSYTNKEVKPDKLKIWKYFLISKIFGLTFGLKLMERGERKAKSTYKDIVKSVAVAKRIAKEEDEHERELLDMIDEEKLRYVGSMVLGLNDALVELTATLAGLTFALQNTRLIATAGLITGIAASFSMGASEYLSTKLKESVKSPFKASLYTFLAYVFTVLFLVSPYLFFTNIYFSLGVTILVGILVILTFTFYVSVAKDMPFKKRFFEMVLISLGISVLSFVIGIFVKTFLGIEL